LVLQLFINLAHQGGARDPRSTPRRLKGIPTAPPQSPKGLFRDPEGLPQDPLSAPKSFFHWCYSYLTIWHTKKSQGTPRASQDAALGSPRYFLRTPRDSSGTPRDLHKTPSALVDRLLPSRDLRFFHDLEGNGPFKRLGLTRTPQEATTYGVGGCREALTISLLRVCNVVARATGTAQLRCAVAQCAIELHPTAKPHKPQTQPQEPQANSYDPQAKPHKPQAQPQEPRATSEATRATSTATRATSEATRATTKSKRTDKDTTKSKRTWTP
jgi:hypothetical protein